ncbi:hypothetical protein GDO78_023020 [Eleutherodactylus coqui]|uniref:Uncharacterized protein n=1 Tax=Eleutherodactylus coqui TaxID=57060 RepID=A0A8J6B8H9_ELECQ|nr:hypothetical protein GDO78_023020 [Eleutherodactylus coqui]
MTCQVPLHFIDHFKCRATRWSADIRVRSHAAERVWIFHSVRFAPFPCQKLHDRCGFWCRYAGDFTPSVEGMRSAAEPHPRCRF